jgi:hypothetical protein
MHLALFVHFSSNIPITVSCSESDSESDRKHPKSAMLKCDDSIKFDLEDQRQVRRTCLHVSSVGFWERERASIWV